MKIKQNQGSDNQIKTILKQNLETKRYNNIFANER